MSLYFRIYLLRIVKEYHPDFKKIEPYYNKLLDTNYSILVNEMNNIRNNMTQSFNNEESFLGEGVEPTSTPVQNGGYVDSGSGSEYNQNE